MGGGRGETKGTEGVGGVRCEGMTEGGCGRRGRTEGEGEERGLKGKGEERRREKVEGRRGKGRTEKRKGT